MTGWDFLDKLASSLYPILTMTMIIVMVVVFIIGFSKHGIEFIKHGFKQTALDESLDKRLKDLGESFDKRLKDLGESLGQRLDELSATQTSQNEALGRRLDELTVTQTSQNEALGQRIDGLHTELDMIKNNHFGHLKSYLEILDGILLDKNIISNKEKALLDNELKGM